MSQPKRSRSIASYSRWWAEIKNETVTRTGGRSPRYPNPEAASPGSTPCRARTCTCAAAGQAIRGEHNNSYSAIWNGRKWRLAAFDRPKGTTWSWIASFSCTSARRCTAAGEYKLHDSTKSRTWIETWNGRAWTHRATPNPRSGPNGTTFEAVSCATRRSCVAVGHRTKLSNGGAFTVAAKSNGNHWKLTASQDQAGADSSSLVDVACPSRRRCVAAALSETFAPSQATAGLSETWNGSSWQLDTTPVPPGALDIRPAAVSCSRPRLLCMSVGNDYDTDPYGRNTPPTIPYALTSSGGAWTLAAAP